MWNPIRSMLTFYVNHSKRFRQPLWVDYEDESGKGYQCPACHNVAAEPWKICERCFYPLPIVGGSKPKEK